MKEVKSMKDWEMFFSKEKANKIFSLETLKKFKWKVFVKKESYFVYDSKGVFIINI